MLSFMSFVPSRDFTNILLLVRLGLISRFSLPLPANPPVIRWTNVPLDAFLVRYFTSPFLLFFCLFYFMIVLINVISNTAITNAIAIAIPPHNGSVTSHHDQFITLHSFKIMNASPKRLKNDIDCFFIFILRLI